ncbi:MAG: winged helix DNA-binding domain-containing protein [Aeromicrobium erythreum]
MHQALAPYRLRAQRLVGSPLPDPAAVVQHLGAVQSQEHLMAPWGVGRRCGATAQEVADGLWPGVVRTHALRTTWHYVHRDDLPLVVAATGDRVLAQVVPHVRRQGLDEARLLAAGDVVEAAVRAEPGCDRARIAEVLRDAGHELSGDLLAHAVMVPELRGAIGGHRHGGERHRYHPLDLPPGPEPRQARAELARRYAVGHGPVSDRDLAWWSSLTLTQAREALDDADLRPVTLAGRALWAADAPEPAPVPSALLLANFDEAISHHRDPDLRAEVGPAFATLMVGTGLLLLDGRLAGQWNRTTGPERVEVRVTAVTSLTPRHRRAIEAEAEAFGAFLGRAADPVVAEAV